MGMLVRFPVERVKPAHENVFESEESTVLILPTVRVERESVAGGGDYDDGNPANGRRRRAPRR